jgi:predicted NUDIX family NTP pyrophosphohydrolase
MARESAGILLFRRTRSSPQPFEVFLAHPGGPFWADKDEGAWTIPKGEIEEGEDRLETAIREFKEETGFLLEGPFVDLGNIRQKSGKVVHAWACEGDVDARAVCSNTFKIQWPPRSGTWLTIPEVDRCGWFDPEVAMTKINPAQGELILRLAKRLSL